MSDENKQKESVDGGVEFNIKFSAIPETNEDVFKKIFTGYEEGLMRSEPGGFVMPPCYCENAENIFRLKPQQGDVWLLTFPKTGTVKFDPICQLFVYLKCCLRYYMDCWTTLATIERSRFCQSGRNQTRHAHIVPRVSLLALYFYILYLNWISI